MKNSKVILFSLALLACVIAWPFYASSKKSDQIKVDRSPGLDVRVVNQAKEKAKNAGKQNAEVLSPLIGEWNYTVTIWTEPGATPNTATGRITNDMVLDDRYLSGSFIDDRNIGGSQVSVKGQSLIGFNSQKNSYSSVWVDTISTGMMVGSGKFDDKEKVINETGKYTDLLEGNEKEYRAELQFTDRDSYKRTIFTTDKAGKEFKMMEIAYSRKL